MDKPRVHLIFTTHWDREWVQPLEQYRFRLVRLMDRVLQILESEPRMRFVTDGQTVMIEDYLAMRPDRRSQIQRLAEDGRIVMGPWYVLADQFLEGPEATIRNLLRGRQIGRSLGSWMKEGYNPDSFGSIAGMPKILKGFGIDCYNFGRGATSDQNTIFCWEADDGSRVLAMNRGYGNAVHLAYPSLSADPEKSLPNKNACLEFGRRFLQNEVPKLPVPVIYASVGVDHMELRPGMTRLVDHLNESTHAEWLISSPQDYFADLKRQLGTAEVECSTGEFRGDVEHKMTLQGVLSTDIPLKQKNRSNELALVRMLEPLTVCHRTLETDNHAWALQRAWQLLLQCHAHDSICACSTDPVMDDIHTRMRQVQELTQIVGERMLADICGAVPSPDTTYITLFNGSHHRNHDAVDLLVRFPRRLPLKSYSLVDAAGAEVAAATVLGYRRKDIETHYATNADLLSNPGKDPEAERNDDEVETLMQIRGVIDFRGSIGFRSLSLVSPLDPEPAVQAGETTLDNGLVAITLNDDGSINLLDKERNRRFEGLCGLEDMADAGDTYDFAPLTGDTPLRSTDAATVSSRLLKHDAHSATLEVTLSWELPAGLNSCGRREQRKHFPNMFPAATDGARSQDTIRHEIVMHYTMYRGMKRIDVRMEFDNQAKQHRLRLAFPTRAGMRVRAGGHFGINSRSWTRTDELLSCRPFVDWLYLENGLGIFAKGLYEYECRALPENEGEVLVTCCRSVDTIGPAAGMNYDVDHALALGRHRVAFALQACENVLDAVHDSSAFNAPVLAAGGTPNLPESVISCDSNELVVTALKPAESNDGFILRFWNPTDHPVTSNIEVDLQYSTVRAVNLAEDQPRQRQDLLHKEDLPPAEFTVAEQKRGYLQVMLPPHALGTCRFYTGKNLRFGTPLRAKAQEQLPKQSDFPLSHSGSFGIHELGDSEN